MSNKSTRANWVYILANYKRGKLYHGSASDLLARLKEHRTGSGSQYVKENGIYRLVYFELMQDMDGALARESRLKRWNRDWKFELIERENPNWQDLTDRAIEAVAELDWQ